MEQTQLDALKAKLEGERETVARALEEYGAVAGEEGMTVEANDGFADSGQATSERAEALAMVEQLQESYAEIVAALSRMDEGTYGKCENCGQEIPFERLEARPTARLCVRCAKQQA